MVGSVSRGTVGVLVPRIARQDPIEYGKQITFGS
jgi:hypothetical protein